MFNFNFKLKLTPLWLFLILLAVLVIAVIFGVNSSNKEGLEGTIKFHKADAALVAFNVPWYQNPLYKLYENNFVDTLTGNIVRVYEDTSGYIGKFTVTDRSGVTTDYSTGKWTSSAPNAITNTVKPWSVSNPDNYATPEVTNTAIAYMPWGKDTFIRTFGDKNTTFFIGGCTDVEDNCSNKSSEHNDIDVSPTIEPVLSQVTDVTQKSLVTYITSKSKLADGVYYDISGCVFVFNTVAPTTTTPSTTTGVNPPTMVTAKRGLNGSATITFTPPTDGIWPSSFVITSTPGSFTITVTAPATKPTTLVPMSGIVTGLINGTPYTFTVVSKKDSMTSVPSTASNAVTLIGLPTIGTITPQNAQNTIVTVPFTPPVGATADDTYIATAKTKGTSTVVATSPASKVSPLTISGLVNGTEYDITVETVIKATEGFGPMFEAIGNMATVTVLKNRFSPENVKFRSDEIDGRQIGNSCIGAFGPESRPISINNVAENITVTDILKQNNPTKSAWTGGTSENGNEWYWVNDNKITGNYANWVDGKTPPPNIRHRVAMRSDGFWENKDSWAQAPEGRRPYLCATTSEKFSTMEGMEGGGTLQIMMYKRDGSAGVPITKIADINATVVNIADFKPLSLKVSATKSVLVVPRKSNTFIAVINKGSDNKYTVENTSLYTPSVKLTVAAATPPATTPVTTTPPATTTPPHADTSDQSEYWKKYWYWQTNGESSDYILKTQVIPPVCPACPGTCTSGGTSGRINSASSSATPGGVIKSLGSDVTGLAKDVVSGGTGLAKDVISSGTGLAKDTVSGGVGLAKDTVSGGVGLIKDTVSGGVGLIKDTVSGGVGLVSDILPTGGSGSNEGGGGGGGGGGRRGGKSAHDVYTYNGALTNKAPSNFMPVTASFSAFSR